MKLLVFNQYYPPDTAATAQRLADLCQGLSRTHHVTVVCGLPSYDPVREAKLAAAEDANDGVHALRVPSTAFHRSNMAGRVCNYLTYLFFAFFIGVIQQKPDLVIAMTDPPVVGVIAWAVARIRRARFLYIVQDLHPDAGVSTGAIRNRLVIGILAALSLFLFRQADRLIAISSSMREKIIDKGVVPEKIEMIPNWVDTNLIIPQPKDNQFSTRYGLTGRFIVMYSGNVGLSQNLEVLIEAAKLLEAFQDIVVVIIGEGSRKADLMQQAQKLGLPNVLFLPYQPATQMQYSFASADVFVIPLATGLDGLVIPSKVFSVMASSRPFIAAIDGTSEVARIAEEFRCGLVVQPGDAEKLSKAILCAYRSREELKAMGVRGRKAVESYYSNKVAISKYERVLLEVMGHIV